MKYPNLCDELMKLGVTSVTEKWHNYCTCELILEGEFNDDDVHRCIYKYSPALYTMVGDVYMSKFYDELIYGDGFTRKGKA